MAKHLAFTAVSFVLLAFLDFVNLPSLFQLLPFHYQAIACMCSQGVAQMLAIARVCFFMARFVAHISSLVGPL